MVSLKTLKTFFDQLKDAYLKEPNIHLILDQEPYNTSTDLQNAAKESGIEVHYLPFLQVPTCPHRRMNMCAIIDF
ncbi:transposase [Holospora undulata]|uniref:transposase n=1 Tax=Holospora undulata TaxID=1169117 RepID=UPI00094AF87B|nr:transposase [Holospora undulata]